MEIDKIYFFEKGDGESWLVCVSNGILYRLNNDGELQYWDAVGMLDSSIVLPSFLTFNDRLLIADGGMRIKAWAGEIDNWSDSYAATFVSTTSFSLDGDVSSYFFAGQSLKADCGVDSIIYPTVKTVEYDDDNSITLITIYSTTPITQNIASVYYNLFTFLPNSPAYPTALAEISSRVVCNSGGSGELDGVYFSAAEDEETWDTSADGVGLRAGYMDGMSVNAFGVLGTDLLVFKGGRNGKRTYRISTSGLASDWYVQLLTANSTATSPAAVEEVVGDLWYADDTGLKSISQVQTYGDLGLSLAGMLIDSELSGRSVREMTFLPSLGVLAIIVSGTPDIFIYHPHNKAFTTWNFGNIRINSICEGGGKVYLAASNGYLYRLGIDDLDEFVSGTTTAVAARAEGRQYAMPADGLIKRTRIIYDELSPATGVVSVGTEKGPTEVVIGNIEPLDSRMLVDSTEELAVASNSLARTQRGYIDFRSRVRSGIFSFSVSTESGRIRLNGLSFDVAGVEG